MLNLEQLKQQFEKEWPRFLEEWKQFLSFASVSVDEDCAVDCIDCVEWLKKHLEAMGFRTSVYETGSQPMFFAERPGVSSKPAVLFYGHYDVQPPDPLDEWTSPPFEPELRDGRLYARGAQDNKGQLFYVIKALETLIRKNVLDVPVKLLIEGEEESGSVGITQFLDHDEGITAADILAVTDTGRVASGAPTIVMGLRGLVHLTFGLEGAKRDLHSGTHGGIAPNAAEELARLAGGLHAEDGSVAIDGFYDGILEPSKRERELAREVEFDAKNYESQTGIPPIAGERAFTPVERAGFRPSLSVNGIHSGYAGAGTKTIIPAKAFVKITARLAAGQDPERCLHLIAEHLEKNTPEGFRSEVAEQGVGGPGFRLDPESRLLAKARIVLDGLGAGATALHWEGASIPVVAKLARVSGAEPLLVGFGSEEDHVHAPDESFSIDQFRLGYLYVASLLQSL